MDLEKVRSVLKDAKTIVIFVLTFLCLILIMNTTCVHNKNNVYKNNIEALTDSVNTLKLNNGNLLSEKKALIVEKDDLNKVIDMNKRDIKDLEKKLDSKIKYISEISQNLSMDTIFLKDTMILYDDSAVINFYYSDDWVNLDGESVISDDSTYYTRLNEMNITTPITVGMDNKNDVFVTSPCPYLSFSNINSAIISDNKDNKKKRWGIGPYVGFGIGYGMCVGNNGVNKGFTIGGSIGIAITYDLFQW